MVSLNDLYYGYSLGGASMCLCLRNILVSIGGFDTKLKSGQDWDLWVRLRTQGQVVVCSKPLVRYMDHFGFFMESPESVDAMFHKVQKEGVPIVKPPKQHRDGSYSFYLSDPDENVIQVLYEPTVAKAKK